MEFLKELFTEPLSFEAFSKAVTDKGFKLADLASGKYVDKDKLDKAIGDLKAANDTVTTLTGELQTLKDNNATAEEWKKKFEDLQNDVSEKEKAAKAEREKAEREANILSRYNAVCVDKDGKALEWSHEAIKAAYLQRFTDALSDEANVGKSDADIFHALTKDDAAAFRGVQPVVNLKGASPLGAEALTKEAFAKMDYASRTKLYNENPTLYNELKGE